MHTIHMVMECMTANKCCDLHVSPALCEPQITL